MTNKEIIEQAFTYFGITTFFGGLAGLAIRKLFYKREDNANLSKTERESSKTITEKYLVELNVNEIIEKKCQAIEEKYKDIIFSMQREHFDLQQGIKERLEKEMRARMEAEKENGLLKEKLQLMDDKIDELTEKLNELGK